MKRAARHKEGRPLRRPLRWACKTRGRTFTRPSSAPHASHRPSGENCTEDTALRWLPIFIISSLDRTSHSWVLWCGWGEGECHDSVATRFCVQPLQSPHARDVHLDGRVRGRAAANAGVGRMPLQGNDRTAVGRNFHCERRAHAWIICQRTMRQCACPYCAQTHLWRPWWTSQTPPNSRPRCPPLNHAPSCQNKG
jgi:hypothetical protein